MVVESGVMPASGLATGSSKGVPGASYRTSVKVTVYTRYHDTPHLDCGRIGRGAEILRRHWVGC